MIHINFFLCCSKYIFCIIQATEEREEMEKLREYNKKLLYNILPDHVAQHFLAQQAKKNDVSFFFNHIIRNTKYNMYFNVI